MAGPRRLRRPQPPSRALERTADVLPDRRINCGRCRISSVKHAAVKGHVPPKRDSCTAPAPIAVPSSPCRTPQTGGPGRSPTVITTQRPSPHLKPLISLVLGADPAATGTELGNLSARIALFLAEARRQIFGTTPGLKSESRLVTGLAGGMPAKSA